MNQSEALFEDISLPDASPGEHICHVIRLRRTYWKIKNSLHTHLEIRFLRKLSSGFQVLEEDAANIGVEEVIERITNLHNSPDGVYLVETCNHSHDWETGYLDDYDYLLVPVIFPGPKLPLDWVAP